MLTNTIGKALFSEGIIPTASVAFGKVDLPKDVPTVMIVTVRRVVVDEINCSEGAGRGWWLVLRLDDGVLATSPRCALKLKELGRRTWRGHCGFLSLSCSTKVAIV
ncbi:hypothetical protein LR48_Vigan03g125400 [Vigna angularis]|uniref:Uncharacterized protein n=1 Tax=Phaseolus angularis TaxID=3914 RepID=A0A0L9U5A4_PHAAN|nr:hypothetical protein LR48_Vigan03g125400 [Vigna angularis]